MNWRTASMIVLIAFGTALILDSFFIHAITFDYSRFRLQALDAWLDHWMIGAMLAGVGGVGLYKSR